jgi:hypothetical protein
MSYEPRKYILSAFDEPIDGVEVSANNSAIELLSNGAGPVFPETPGYQAEMETALSMSTGFDSLYNGFALIMLMIDDLAGATVSVTDAYGMAFSLLKSDAVAWLSGATTFQWWLATTPSPIAYGEPTVTLSAARSGQMKIINVCNLRSGNPIGLSYSKPVYTGPFYQEFIDPSEGSLLLAMGKSPGSLFRKTYGPGTFDMMPVSYNHMLRSDFNP